jgi:hypothetical protein
MLAVPTPAVTCRGEILALGASDYEPLMVTTNAGSVQVLGGDLCDIHGQAVPVCHGRAGKLVGVAERKLPDTVGSDQLCWRGDV